MVIQVNIVVLNTVGLNNPVIGVSQIMSYNGRALEEEKCFAQCSVELITGLRTAIKTVRMKRKHE